MMCGGSLASCSLWCGGALLSGCDIGHVTEGGTVAGLFTDVHCTGLSMYPSWRVCSARASFILRSGAVPRIRSYSSATQLASVGRPDLNGVHEARRPGVSGIGSRRCARVERVGPG